MSNDLTVAKLQKLLETKTARLEKLHSRRNQLAKSLGKVERKIVSLEGVVRIGKRGRKRGRRGQNDRSLIQFAQEILGQHKKGLALRDLTDKILAAGYKTNSSNFAQTVYQSIYLNQDKVAHDTKAGLYKLAAKAQKSAKREKAVKS